MSKRARVIRMQLAKHMLRYLSEEDVAYLLGVKQQTINNWRYKKLTASEVACVLGVTRQTVQEWIQQPCSTTYTEQEETQTHDSRDGSESSESGGSLAHWTLRERRRLF
jgi:DNA-binding XRE family transcriptional regulator